MNTQFRKSTLTVAFLVFVIFFNSGYAQDKKNRPAQVNKKKDSLKAKTVQNANEEPKAMNLLDEQTKLFGDVFSGFSDEELGDMKDMKGLQNYGDLLNKIDMEPEMEAKMWTVYKLYDKSLDPKEKDSLKVELEKMFASLKTKNQKPKQ